MPITSGWSVQTFVGVAKGGVEAKPTGLMCRQQQNGFDVASTENSKN
jgi:hypothetical protein